VIRQDDEYFDYAISTLTPIFVCSCEPRRQFEADFLAGREAEYPAHKERPVRTLIELLEQRLVDTRRWLYRGADVGTQRVHGTVRG
jgi:hypothetical protein